MKDTSPEALHTAPRPALWDELVAHSSQLLAAHGSPRAVLGSHDPLAPLVILDDETLDHHRYYGFGAAMAHLQHQIDTPETRASITHDMATALVAQHTGAYGVVPNRRGLELAKVSYDATGAPFEPYISDAVEAMPPAVRLTLNMLQGEQRRRLMARHGIPANEYFVYTSILSDVVTKHLKVTVTAAATIAFNAVIERRHGHMHFAERGRTLPREKFDADNRATASDVLHGSEPDQLNLVALGMRAAGLRVDEFRRLQDFLTTDKDGSVQFDRSRVVPAADLQPIADILHVQRLRCPAVYVRGLIPLLMTVIPEAVQSADAAIAQRNAGSTNV